MFQVYGPVTCQLSFPRCPRTTVLGRGPCGNKQWLLDFRMNDGEMPGIFDTQHLEAAALEALFHIELGKLYNNLENRRRRPM